MKSLKTDLDFLLKYVKNYPGALLWPPGILWKLAGWRCAEGFDNGQFVVTAAAVVEPWDLYW